MGDFNKTQQFQKATFSKLSKIIMSEMLEPVGIDLQQHNQLKFIDNQSTYGVLLEC
jgi:hypothetical protein